MRPFPTPTLHGWFLSLAPVMILDRLCRMRCYHYMAISAPYMGIAHDSKTHLNTPLSLAKASLCNTIMLGNIGIHALMPGQTHAAISPGLLTRQQVYYVC